MATFKIIKKKDFVVDTVNHTAYTVAHQGRVFNVSTLAFETGEITATATHITIGCKVEAVPDTYTNAVGERVIGYKIMPKLDLSIGVF